MLSKRPSGIEWRGGWGAQNQAVPYRQPGIVAVSCPRLAACRSNRVSAGKGCRQPQEIELVSYSPRTAHSVRRLVRGSCPGLENRLRRVLRKQGGPKARGEVKRRPGSLRRDERRFAAAATRPACLRVASVALCNTMHGLHLS
ncbi:hypothetical protein AAT19DRAFT_9799 [Rhodotorula toruloides]|uniref:Uncharacterized protein n=1 Tax=Rhodotorula toruloides TaxID=5286 RepID=A0A2T0A110_RHOTO|nr:hypothetical protein AAT19DRAFT_9799 [Rhodotorula toruloides]